MLKGITIRQLARVTGISKSSLSGRKSGTTCLSPLSHKKTPVNRSLSYLNKIPCGNNTFPGQNAYIKNPKITNPAIHINVSIAPDLAELAILFHLLLHQGIAFAAYSPLPPYFLLVLIFVPIGYRTRFELTANAANRIFHTKGSFG